MRRLPLDHLWVPSRELEDDRRWPWASVWQQTSGMGEQAGPASLDDLSAFRCAFYDCLSLRADALFELADAVLCAEGPVSTLVGLTLTAEHRRGHGALYDGLDSGRIEVGRLRRSLASLPVPRDTHGRITLAVDVRGVAAPGRGDQPRSVVLSRLRAGQGSGTDDPRLALFLCGGAGVGPHVVDRATRRGAPGSPR